MEVWIQAVIAGSIAAGVGLAEIVTRYRSDPGQALRSPAALVYISLNWGAGFGALFLVDALGWRFGQSGHVVAWRILISGFGALALFRSSLFMARIGGSDVAVGPNVVVEALLNACDREVDRKCAQGIAKQLRSGELDGLDPGSIAANLPVLCLALMQNFQASDQALLGAELNKIQTDNKLAPEAKTRAVIIQLAKFLGAEFVLSVIQDNPTLFRTPRAAASAPVLQQAQQLIAEGADDA